MTVLAIAVTPGEYNNYAYGVVTFGPFDCPLKIYLNLQQEIGNDLAGYYPSDYSPFIGQFSLYTQSQPTETPTLYQSAMPKYNLGQWNSMNGGYVIAEGFLNYLNQLVLQGNINYKISSFQDPYGQGIYADYSQSPPNQLVPLDSFNSLALDGTVCYTDGVALNFTFTGTVSILIYYGAWIIQNGAYENGYFPVLNSFANL